jgi:energy-coupling factor transport system ATP-binding protein
MSIAIEIKDYSWRYLNTQECALKNLNLTVEEGAFLGIIGPNNSGKTTLAYSLNGLIPGQYQGIKQGSIHIFGKEVEEYSGGDLQKTVGVVFSDPEAQFTAMTVEDELIFGMENMGMNIPEIKERLEWVASLANLQPLMEKPPYEISGGQKQRVALAAVLAMTPRIMVLDEPTSMLDPLSRKRIFDVLARLKSETKNTIIVIEHSLENLIPLADSMLLLHNGDCMLAGPTREFFRQADVILKNDAYPPGVLDFFYALHAEGLFGEDFPLTLDEGDTLLHRLIKSAPSEFGDG